MRGLGARGRARQLRRRRHGRPTVRGVVRGGPSRLGRRRDPGAPLAGRCPWRRPATSAPRRPSSAAPRCWSSSTSTASRARPWSARTRDAARRPTRQCCWCGTGRLPAAPAAPDGYPLDGLDAPTTRTPARPPLPPDGSAWRRRRPVLVAVLRRARRGLAPRRRLLRGLRRLRRRGHRLRRDSPLGRRQLCWWAVRAPTTSTTRVRRHRCSTSPTSCATPRLRRRWGRWPMEGWLREFERMGLVEREDGEWRLTPSGRQTARA